MPTIFKLQAHMRMCAAPLDATQKSMVAYDYSTGGEAGAAASAVSQIPEVASVTVYEVHSVAIALYRDGQKGAA